MKALTIYAPWAWQIVHGDKRVENRRWATNWRGPLAIHAGLNRRDDRKAAAFIRAIGRIPATEAELDAIRGKIIGLCRVETCYRHEEPATLFDPDPWACGPVCWVLADVRPIRPVAATGKRSLWTPPEGLLGR